jgi:hypothetical protein
MAKEEKKKRQKTGQHLDDSIEGMQKNMAYTQLQLALRQTEFARQDQTAAADMEERGRVAEERGKLSEARGQDLQQQAISWADQKFSAMKDAETHCVSSCGSSETFQVSSRLVPLLLGISMFTGCLYIRMHDIAKIVLLLMDVLLMFCPGSLVWGRHKQSVLV